MIFFRFSNVYLLNEQFLKIITYTHTHTYTSTIESAGSEPLNTESRLSKRLRRRNMEIAAN